MAKATDRKDQSLSTEEIIERLSGFGVLPIDYVEENSDLAMAVVKNDGHFMDLDCMVAISNALDRRISYEEYSYINGTDLYDDRGLFNVNKDDAPILNALLEERPEIDSISYISYLPEKYKTAFKEVIKKEIKKQLPNVADKAKDMVLENAMSERICNLECYGWNYIDWRQVIFDALIDAPCRESTVKTTQTKIIRVNRELEEGIYRFCMDELNYHINESYCTKEYDSEIKSQIELLKLLGYEEEATKFEQQYKEKVNEK